MKRKGCLKTFLLVWLGATVLSIIIGVITGLTSRSAKETAQHPSATAVAANAPSVSAGLMSYANQAKALAADLDTQKTQSGLLDTFNEKYEAGNYQDAYTYYQQHLASMRASCWAMNNVGLAMLQLQKNEDALVVYMAIQYKTKGSQPESLINLLIAGHAMGFGPKELLDAVGMDADLFQKSLESKAYSTETIDGMIRSLCYNIIYMRMEEPGVGANATIKSDALDIDSLLKDEASRLTLYTQLKALGSTDEDVQELLNYFDALLRLRREQAKS